MKLLNGLEEVLFYYIPTMRKKEPMNPSGPGAFSFGPSPESLCNSPQLDMKSDEMI
jgi:hypothetical protein